jgi:hypothetical protein
MQMKCLEKEQRLTIELLITLCEGDDKFIESTKLYGNWFDHMVDQLADLDEGKD